MHGDVLLLGGSTARRAVEPRASSELAETGTKEIGSDESGWINPVGSCVKQHAVVQKKIADS